MKLWKSGLLAGGACAAACAAPLVAAPFIAGAAGLGFAIAGETALGLAALAGAGAWFLWRRRTAGNAAESPAAAGCDPGKSCAAPTGR